MADTLSQRPRVQIVEVAPRDGLQSDAVHFSTSEKVELIERIVAAGIERVEVASFVNPERVPQMADAEAVLGELAARALPARWIGLVLNARGLDRALAAHTPEVNVVVACSDTFSRKNQGVDTEASVVTAIDVIERCRDALVPVSVTLSAAFGCGYEGVVPLDRVVAVAERIGAAAPAELALADTIGAAVPPDVRARFAAVRAVIGDGVRLRAHFHNTRNTAVANVLAAVEAGVGVVDASLGGIGGCPFSPRATGNVATEDVVYLLERSGYDTGVDIDRLVAASAWLEERLGRTTPALVSKAAPFPPR